MQTKQCVLDADGKFPGDSGVDLGMTPSGGVLLGISEVIMGVPSSAA